MSLAEGPLLRSLRLWLLGFCAVAGLTLQEAVNKVRIPGHFGPHSKEYHGFIYNALDAATAGFGKQAARDALMAKLEELACDAATPGTELWKLLMQL